MSTLLGESSYTDEFSYELLGMKMPAAVVEMPEVVSVMKKLSYSTQKILRKYLDGTKQTYEESDGPFFYNDSINHVKLRGRSLKSRSIGQPTIL